MPVSEGAATNSQARSEIRPIRVHRESLLIYVLAGMTFVGIAGTCVGVARALGAEDQVERARQEISTIESTLQDLRGKSTSLKAEADAAQVRRDAAADEVRLATESRDQLRKEFEKLRSDADAARAVITQSDSASQQLTLLRQQLAEIEPRNKQLQDQATVARKAVADSELQVAELLKRAAVLSGQVAAADMLVRQGQEAQEALRKAQAEYQSIVTKKSELEAGISVAEQKARGLSEQVRLLETKATQLAGVQSDLEAGTRRAGALDAEIKQLEPRLKESRELTARRDELDKEVKRLEVLKAQTEATVGSLGSIGKVADQLDQVLRRVAESLSRVDRAAGANKEREAGAAGPRPASGGEQP